MGAKEVSCPELFAWSLFKLERVREAGVSRMEVSLSYLCIVAESLG